MNAANTLAVEEFSSLIPENLNASDGGLRHINFPSSSSKPRTKAFSAQIS
jgi:hypothetical protein